MSFEFRLEPKGSCLHATVTGRNGRDTVIGYFEELRAKERQ